MDIEQGRFFIGQETGDGGEPVIYDGADLTTHGVIVGMTGSGKTGLGITILEEALLNDIPCLVIDPKGDMGNLLLNFPDFSPADFRPWIDEAEAERQGVTPDQLAAETATTWKEGLSGSGITSDRLTTLRDNSEMTIYTPGSGAGVGLDVLGSMRAPSLDWESQAELIHDEIEAFVSSLLTLAGIEADPVSSPEHILLATIIETFWREDRDLDLATLIGQVPKPPFRKLGVFDVDTFFPEKERMELAMKLNGLLASPSFAAWLEGVPLDIGEMLSGGDKTKCAIIYLTHLSDTERLFVVALLLSKLVTWFRGQPGTAELRALVYMDEVFGFAPPTAEPPSKKPILTVLKQARAHGVGMILSTQNPVDLDYKAMSNAGTWMVGRLQTENDKRRILEGMESATGTVDVKAYDKLISDLEKRQFVMTTTKAPEPTLFGTRWAMSYLAGPLTRDQVSLLMKDKAPSSPVVEAPDAAPSDVPTALESAAAPAEPAAAGTEPPATAAPAAAPAALDDDQVPVMPEVAEGVAAMFLDPAATWAGEVGADPTGTRYEPAAAATVNLVYDDTKASVNHQEVYEAVIFPLGAILAPESVRQVDHDPRDFVAAPPAGPSFAIPEVKIDTKAYWNGLDADLKNHLVGARKVTIFKNAELGLYSRPGESREEFLARATESAEQAKDDAIAKLKDKYQTRLERARTTLSKAENRVADLEATAGSKQTEELLSGAGDLIGVLLGGSKRSNPLGGAARRRSASSQARARAENARAALEEDKAEMAELEADLQDEVADLDDEYAAQAETVEEVEIPLEKTDIRVVELKLVWIPTG
ncbi:MAG: ATP-binding protein [Acidimicrobiia bacterium]